MSDHDTTGDEIRSPEELFRTAVLFESALGLVAILLGLTVGPDARAMVPRLSDAPWPELIQGLAYGFIAALPMWWFMTAIRHLPLRSVQELEEIGSDGLFKLLLRLTPVEMIVVSLCAGVGEELLFRGWLLPAVASWIGGMDDPPSVVAAVIVSSVAFGLVHPVTRLYVVLATIIGAYLAALLLWTENLLVPIVAHAVYDAIQMIVAKHSSTD